MTSNMSRPTTPVPVLVETTNLTYLHDLETPPITPLNRTIPLMFPDCPPAPRPRKRIFRLDHLDADTPADIFLPSRSQLIDSEEDAPPLPTVLFLESETPLPQHTIVAPKPNKRRIVGSSIRRSVGGRRIRPLPKIQTDLFENSGNENDNDTEEVRINFRRSFNIADLGKTATTSTTTHADIKLWPSSNGIGATGGTSSSRANILKRRNSYNALCA